MLAVSLVVIPGDDHVTKAVNHNIRVRFLRGGYEMSVEDLPEVIASRLVVGEKSVASYITFHLKPDHHIRVTGRFGIPFANCDDGDHIVTRSMKGTDTMVVGSESSRQETREEVKITSMTRCPLKAERNNPLPSEIDDLLDIWPRVVRGPPSPTLKIAREVETGSYPRN